MMSNFVSMNGLRPCFVGASISMMLLNPTLAYFSHSALYSIPPTTNNLDVLRFSQKSFDLWSKKNAIHYDLSRLVDVSSLDGGSSLDGSSSDGSSSDGDGDGGGGDGGGRRKHKSQNVPLYCPKSETQRLYVSLLQDPKIPLVIAHGPAGSGKTLFACMQAVTELKKGNIQKIVMTRPLISVEEEQIGFLPGNMVSKMDPWTRPMIDIFREFFSMAEIQNMIRNGVIEIAPLAYMRGRTFHRTFVIADEMQNSSPNQMMMLTTRLGKESKMVITGDLQQSDRDSSGDRTGDRSGDRSGDVNGLVDFLVRFRNTENNDMENDEFQRRKDLIQTIEMSLVDVFRSNLVKRILQIYNTHRVDVDSDHSSETTESYELLSSPEKPIKNDIPLRDMGRPYPNS